MGVLKADVKFEVSVPVTEADMKELSEVLEKLTSSSFITSQTKKDLARLSKYVKVYVDISAYSCLGIKVIQYKHAESLEDLL